MGVLLWLTIGVAAGFLTKLAMPGPTEEPSGFLGTMLLGIVGAVIGGWAWNLILNQPGATGFDLGTLFISFVGAVAVIGLMRLMNRPPVERTRGNTL